MGHDIGPNIKGDHLAFDSDGPTLGGVDPMLGQCVWAHGDRRDLDPMFGGDDTMLANMGPTFAALKHVGVYV